MPTYKLINSIGSLDMSLQLSTQFVTGILFKEVEEMLNFLETLVGGLSGKEILQSQLGDEKLLYYIGKCDADLLTALSLRQQLKRLKKEDREIHKLQELCPNFDFEQKISQYTNFEKTFGRTILAASMQTVCFLDNVFECLSTTEKETIKQLIIALQQAFSCYIVPMLSQPEEGSYCDGLSGYRKNKDTAILLPLKLIETSY